jgi:malate synthase
VERHVLVDGRPVSASLFDFGLYLHHNARDLLDRGTGPYFYLPKLEGHLEARLWNDVFVHAQGAVGVPVGSIRATVLIENILAAFEMHEILYELRDHSAGLNCGRWDYIFSAIRKFRHHPEWILPDRAQVTMTRHMMRSYSLLLIQTCHRRGIHAMGGMAAQIPIKGDAAAHGEAMEKVRLDKEREASDGHDGTWVAHPGLVPLARDVFDAHMAGPNQIHRVPDTHVTAADLLRVPSGTITEAGVRTNVDVAIRYLASWLSGGGCVPIYNLMEDAATAEISRAQLWQWTHHPTARMADGRSVTLSLVRAYAEEALDAIGHELGPQGVEAGRYREAARLLDQLVAADAFVEFLTVPAYELLA